MRAVTRPADPAAAPRGPISTAFSSPRRELRGWGVAATIEVPAPWSEHLDVVSDALAAIDVEDEVGEAGSGPVAFGALPFDRRSAARLVVPTQLWGRTPEGRHWTTTVTDPAASGAREPVSSGSGPAADAGGEPMEVRVAAPREVSAWKDAVTAATKRIASGELTKVVLARELVVTRDRPWDPGEVFERLSAAHPRSLRFCVDGFCGASPELLVSRVGDVVRAQPMAGTTPRTGEPEADARRAGALLGSDKNRAEHQITIDVVHESLLPWCSYLDAEPEPSVVAAGSVQHLATMVEGRLSHPPPTVLDLVSVLHPTPAVGGWPRPEALALIEELEADDRGRYAGPVGWVDAGGNGAWAVGIRSVSLDGPEARLWAGVGVVADSDPVAELEETRAKFAATLGHLVRI